MKTTAKILVALSFCSFLLTACGGEADPKPGDPGYGEDVPAVVDTITDSTPVDSIVTVEDDITNVTSDTLSTDSTEIGE